MHGGSQRRAGRRGPLHRAAPPAGGASGGGRLLADGRRAPAGPASLAARGRRPGPTAPPRSRRRWRGVALAGGALLLVQLGALSMVELGAAAPGWAASHGRFSFAPYTPPGSAVPRSFFDYQLQPGQKIQDAVTLSNLSNHSAGFIVYPSDAQNTTDGGAFALDDYGTTMHGVGTWVHSAVSRVILAPHQAETFGYILQVPPGTGPGDYAGGLVALSTTVTSADGGALHLSVRQAIGVRIFVQVAGTITPAIAVTGLHPTARGAGTAAFVTGGQRGRVAVRLTNTGNALYRSVVVRLRTGGTHLGGAPAAAATTVTDLIPHQSVVVQLPWRAAGPGTYDLAVLLRASTGTGPATMVSASTTVWDVPWPDVVIVLAILAVAALLVRRRVRRHRRRPPQGLADDPERDQGPAAPEAAPAPAPEPLSGVQP